MPPKNASTDKKGATVQPEQPASLLESLLPVWSDAAITEKDEKGD
jgi:hypothetical protein